jgi:hypothetical protein
VTAMACHQRRNLRHRKPWARMERARLSHEEQR